MGHGKLVKKINKLERKYENVKYLGYIGDRVELCKLYGVADALWSFADTTYISRPAVEALASGTPIIIPDAPVYNQMQNVRIGHNLIPKEVGWILNNDDIEGISKLILRIKRENVINDAMRVRCREYAKKEYSMKNIEVVIESLNQLCMKN